MDEVRRTVVILRDRSPIHVHVRSLGDAVSEYGVQSATLIINVLRVRPSDILSYTLAESIIDVGRGQSIVYACHAPLGIVRVTMGAIIEQVARCIILITG